jgi:hypothetical protein
MFTQGTNSDVNGTSLVGEVVITRNEIEKVFGAPTYETNSDFEKVTTEWVLVFDNGVVATIYDWKRYEMGAPEMDETYEWHIGGRNFDAKDEVLKALGRN